MEKERFYNWLVEQGYNKSTISSRISNVLRIEEFERSLDYHFDEDEMKGILSKLSYGMKEMMNSKIPNHRIPINGNVKDGTATYRAAANLYKKFKMDIRSEKRVHNASRFEREIDNGSNRVNSRQIIDSYQELISAFNISKDEFYQYGIDNTIFPDYDLVASGWSDLKRRLFGGDKVTIRGAGRDAKSTPLFLKFYKLLFKNPSIEKDPTNNAVPQRIIQNLTGLKRNHDIYNYQVAHIYGRTKNPLMFEAPWNIAYVPKPIDPLTGHETKRHWPKEYQKRFFQQTNSLYREFIVDYNEIIKSMTIDEHLIQYAEMLEFENIDSEIIDRFKRSVRREFELIKINQ